MNKLFMRTTVKSFYDIQKIRIQVGNRITTNVRVRLGQDPGTKTDEMDADAIKLLDSLKDEYNRITDELITSSARSKVKAIQKTGGVITDLLEFELVGYYIMLLEQEETFLKAITNQVKDFEIWKKHMADVKGCGPLMAAVVISELDPHKAKYISSFWKYAGLDTVLNQDSGEYEGRSRKSHHLEEKAYIDKDGKDATRKGITFNPFLKTKLIGVLGSSFLKAGGKYREIYDNYKHRLECRPDLKDESKGKRHNMAIRYTVKRFLADLWVAWRQIEGLPVTEDYATAKLGYKHGA
jgi:hypothetical protein